MNLFSVIKGGFFFQSPKMPTMPQEKIRRITSSSPNNPLSPFYDASGAPMKPVARLTVTRQRVYDKPCDDKEAMASPTIIYPHIEQNNNTSAYLLFYFWLTFEYQNIVAFYTKEHILK